MNNYSTSNLDLPANREAGLWGVIRMLGWGLLLASAVLFVLGLADLGFDPAISAVMAMGGSVLLMAEHRHRLMYRVQDLEQEVEELTQTIEELRENPQGRDE